MRIVIDASAAFEFLLRTPIGVQLTPTFRLASLYAPELLDVEVVAVLRKYVLHHALSLRRATQVLEDLAQWDVERISHRVLLSQAWKIRDNVSSYDAMYVAVAKQYNATLLTADGPLSRAPIQDVVIQNVR